MNVLVVGKGGREHALVWKLARSPRAGTVFCAPGNAGTARDGVNVAVEPTDFAGLIAFVRKNDVGLTVVGPEEPLALGVVDAFQKEGLRIFGPTKEAARLEASKVFSKNLMRHADVPTAEFRVFDHPDPARHYIETREYPLVVKADGLAAGKGVIVCSTSADALAAVERIMVREELGRAAGRRVVIEKRLQGAELSVMALVANRCLLPLPPCQDHKAAYDHDEGPNTGGMGAYCPAPLGTPALLEAVNHDVFGPTVHAMKRDLRPFRGVLYAGLMVTPQGPRVLEFNVRFGDPETQPLLMRLKSDLLDLLDAVAEGPAPRRWPTARRRPDQAEPAVDGRLADFDGKVEWDPRPAVCVVLASKGYPGHYDKGLVIDGLDEAAKLPDVKVFHAGTRQDRQFVLTDGGRVLGVTALGDTLADARKKAYEAVACVRFTGMHYRRDIAAKAEARPEKQGG
jgi:phosphoribosylamine--glycine ligase